MNGWLEGDDATAVERLDVYANMYFFRLLEAIQTEVPKLAALLGPDRFHNLVVDYLLAHPSTDPSLRHAAAALPAFVAGVAEGLSRGDLADLARLDLARNNVFDAAEDPKLDGPSLASIPSEDWPMLRFEVRRGVRWLRVRASALGAWRALSEGREAPDDDPTMSGCAGWRGADQQSWLITTTRTTMRASPWPHSRAGSRMVCCCACGFDLWQPRIAWNNWARAVRMLC